MNATEANRSGLIFSKVKFRQHYDFVNQEDSTQFSISHAVK